MKTIIKPWGKEEWLELNDAYCYKRIYINAGYKTSYQYHNFKRETNFIISGEAEIWLENDEGVVEKKIMKAGEYFNVTPPKKHRVIALTDIILQEVSTPEVDDVIRIDDEFARANGKIEGEHQTPAVLILAAGLGTRLGNLTKEINKALLPINNRAIISHIIDKFPKEYEFIIAIGYKGDAIKEYCELAFPNRKFTFIEIDNVDGYASGPGYSALQCKELLQRPFYIATCDCLIDSPMPHLDGNWLGIQPTSYPEKYSTVQLNGNDIIGYSDAEIGRDTHTRPIIEINIEFNGSLIPNVKVSPVDRTDKSTPFLANRTLMRRMGLIVNPNKAFVVTEEPEDKYSPGKAKGEAHAGIYFENK